MGNEESKETSHRDINAENVIPHLRLSPYCDSPATASSDSRYGDIEFIDVGYAADVFRKRLPFKNGRTFINVSTTFIF